MRNFKANPGHRFSEHIRKQTSKAKVPDRDQTETGKGMPMADEGPTSPEAGGSSGNRAGKANAPSGTTKNDVHKIKGKVHRVEIEAAHGGAKVRIHYHRKKGKHGMGYAAPEEHVHGSMASAKKHAMSALSSMAPEDPDTGAMAGMLD